MLSLHKRLHALEQVQQNGLTVEITSTQLGVSTPDAALAPKYGLRKEMLRPELSREAMRAARNWLHITQRELSEQSGVHLASQCLLLLHRLEAYHRQFADRVELFRHWHMLVFTSDARSFVTDDRGGNPLGDIAGE